MALGGKRAQFDRLMSASLPAALRFAVRLTGRLDTAEEVVQEAMLAASRSWKTYRGEAQFRTWLFRIVVNTFRNRLARPTGPKSLETDLVDVRQRSPSDLAAAAELSETIARCVAELPLRQREVLVLSVYENLDAAADRRGFGNEHRQRVFDAEPRAGKVALSIGTVFGGEVIRHGQ